MKKLTFLLLVAVLLITAVSGASLAYFTDTEISALNTVTSGNIQIIQHEQERVTDVEGSVTLQPFTQNQELMPLVQNGESKTVTLNVSGHDVKLRDESFKNYIDKIVTVQNVGVNPAYLRTVIAVPYVKDADWIHFDKNETGWIWSEEPVIATIGGIDYALYSATYATALAEKSVSSPSLLGFWVDSHVDFDGTNYYLGSTVLGDLSKFQILVCTQAVQTTSFNTVDEALTSTFKAITTDNNPWVNEQTHYIKNNDDFQALLNSNEISSGDTIRLADGEYVLPAVLPAGVRIVGQSCDVIITGPAEVMGIAIELHNLTIKNAFKFTGNGEFDQATFQSSFSATFNNPAYIVDCVFASAPQWSVTEDAVRSTVIFENCTVPDPVYN